MCNCMFVFFFRVLILVVRCVMLDFVRYFATSSIGVAGFGGSSVGLFIFFNCVFVGVYVCVLSVSVNVSDVVLCFIVLNVLIGVVVVLLV